MKQTATQYSKKDVVKWKELKGTGQREDKKTKPIGISLCVKKKEIKLVSKQIKLKDKAGNWERGLLRNASGIRAHDQHA